MEGTAAESLRPVGLKSVVARVRRFLAPPVFADERQTEEAGKMWSVLIGLFATVTVFFPLTALSAAACHPVHHRRRLE